MHNKKLKESFGILEENTCEGSVETECFFTGHDSEQAPRHIAAKATCRVCAKEQSMCKREPPHSVCNRKATKRVLFGKQKPRNTKRATCSVCVQYVQ